MSFEGQPRGRAGSGSIRSTTPTICCTSRSWIEVCEEAAARCIPVQLPLRVLMNWGMPALDLGWMTAIVERHPKVPWILTGLNYFHELRIGLSLMRRFPSVHVETSCIQGFEAISKIVEEIGSERILFGTALAATKCRRGPGEDPARAHQRWGPGSYLWRKCLPPAGIEKLMNEIRIGILGSGFMGRTNAETVTRYLPGAKLMAVAGGTRAGQLALDYGVDCEPAPSALLGRDDIDAVLISTPHAQHGPQATEAARRGKHVLLDKPMATSVAECDAIIEAVKGLRRECHDHVRATVPPGATARLTG